MSDLVSRPSWIPDLTEFVRVDEPLTPPIPRAPDAPLPRWIETAAVALVVLGAAVGCYQFGMRLLAQWQWL